MMLIDFCTQHKATGNASFKTDSIIDVNEQVDLSGSDVKMAAPHEKNYGKTWKDS